MKKLTTLIMTLLIWSIVSGQANFVQTDWSGGAGQTVMSDLTKFSASYLIDYSSVTGEISNIISPGTYFYGMAEYNGKIIVGTSGGNFIYDPVNNTWTHSVCQDALLYHHTIHNGILYSLYGYNVFTYDGTLNDYGMGPNGWKHHSTLKPLNIESTYTIENINGDLIIGARYSGYRGCALKWNGQSWQQMGGTFSNGVICFAEYNGTLYAGTHWSGQVYKWTGSSWVISGYTGNMTVHCLKVYNGQLYAAGYNSSYYSGRINRFNGSSWSTFQYTYGVRDMKIHNNKLVFSMLKSTSPGEIWQYDGSSFSKLYSLTTEQYSFDMLSFGGDLYYGGLRSFSGSVSSNFYKNGNVLDKIYFGAVYSSEITNTGGQWGTLDYDGYATGESGISVFVIGKDPLTNTNRLPVYIPKGSTVSTTDATISYRVYLWSISQNTAPVFEEIRIGASTVANLEAFSAADDILCHGGTVDVTITATGGTPPYTGTGSFQESAGTHTFTVTDANGNTAQTTVTLTEPDALQASIDGLDISCYGESDGHVNLSVAGGIAPYTYVWNTGATTEDITGLTAGNYEVVITDANGCQNNSEIILTEPTQLMVDAGADDAFCLGATKVLGGSPAATGSTPPYSYSWSPSTDLSGTNIPDPVASPATDGNFTYTLEVTDANGCMATDDVSLTVYPLPVASITASNADYFCNGLTLTANSSTSENKYDWSNNENTQSIFLSIDEDVAGSYSVMVTDQNGCVSNNTATYAYKPEESISSYTILGFDQVHLGDEHTVNNGGVGVTNSTGKAMFGKSCSVEGSGSFVKSPVIQTGKGTSITTQIKSVASVDLPTMYENGSYASTFSNYKVKSGTKTITGDYINVNIAAGATAKLTGNYFGTVTVGEGATVNFTAADIEILHLDIKETKASNGRSSVIFDTDAIVKIAEKMHVRSNCDFNTAGKKVIIYAGVKNVFDGEVHVSSEDVDFYGSIYAPYGQILVNMGGNKGTTYMTGAYIAKLIKAQGNKVIWNWHNCNNSNGSAMMRQAMSENVPELGIEEALRMDLYPNPFNDMAQVEFEIENAGQVTIELYDVTGKRIEVLFDGQAEEGTVYKLQLQGHDLKSGMYLLRMVSGNEIITKRAILSR